LNRAIIEQELTDNKTGRPYFQPRTGRNPEGRGIDVSVNIGSHLYEKAMEKKIKTNYQVEVKNKPDINKNSEQMAGKKMKM